MDYGKFKYEKIARKSTQKSWLLTEPKMVCFVSTHQSEHDVRCVNSERFLREGQSAVCQFKGREMLTRSWAAPNRCGGGALGEFAIVGRHYHR